MIDPRTATAKDYDKAARLHGNGAWASVAITIVVWYFFDWFALIPLANVFYCGLKVLSYTKAEMQLEKGIFKTPNRNNGAPNGDATGMTDQELEDYMHKQSLEKLRKSAKEGKLFR